MRDNVFIHSTATVSDDARIGSSTKIWNYSQIRENVVIGSDCNIASFVYIDFDVKVGNKVKIQNRVSIYHQSIIEDGVFIGPHVCFSNDKTPRAITVTGQLKSNSDWEASKIYVKEGASIGANSTILPNITIGRFAMIGAGSVVTKDVPDFGLIIGNPAKLAGFVCKCGRKIHNGNLTEPVMKKCPHCGTEVKLEKFGE